MKSVLTMSTDWKDWNIHRQDSYHLISNAGLKPVHKKMWLLRQSRAILELDQGLYIVNIKPEVLYFITLSFYNSPNDVLKLFT